VTEQAPKRVTEQATLCSVRSAWNRVSLLCETLCNENEDCEC